MTRRVANRAGTHLRGDRPVFSMPAKIPEGAEGVHSGAQFFFVMGAGHRPCRMMRCKPDRGGAPKGTQRVPVGSVCQYPVVARHRAEVAQRRGASGVVVWVLREGIGEKRREPMSLILKMPSAR